MSKLPTFMYGPRDGAEVPVMLWALDQIELMHKLSNGKRVIYCYELDPEDKNYYFKGQFDDESGELNE